MDRKLLHATLRQKTLLSAVSQTWQLDFEANEALQYTSGQFYSFVTERDGKEEVRAYSLVHAPADRRMSLCLNRAGYFSSLLLDLPVGGEVSFHGPYGAFILREGPGIILADGPGIAPVAAFVDELLAEQKPCDGVHLFHVAAAEEEFFYRSVFEEAERRLEGFHYRRLIGRSDLERQLASLVEDSEPKPTAYIVGLNEFAAPLRQFFKDRGWDRKQIVFERYD